MNVSLSIWLDNAKKLSQKTLLIDDNTPIIQRWCKYTNKYIPIIKLQPIKTDPQVIIHGFQIK
jgi:hypothetical protein